MLILGFYDTIFVRYALYTLRKTPVMLVLCVCENPMNIFISHNKKQKSQARLLAMALAEHGESVWFDEWTIRPGESLTGGIEEGLTSADVFVLLWSEEAANSNWVRPELRAYIRRRVDDKSLRIIPIMMDETPIPTLVADYRGFTSKSSMSLGTIAAQICGDPTEAELVRRLKERINELTYDDQATGDPLPFERCPECGENEFKRQSHTDYRHDEIYYVITCNKCGWTEWTQ
jgi:ribosomal protein S27AE